MPSKRLREESLVAKKNVRCTAAIPFQCIMVIFQFLCCNNNGNDNAIFLLFAQTCKQWNCQLVKFSVKRTFSVSISNLFYLKNLRPKKLIIQHDLEQELDSDCISILSSMHLRALECNIPVRNDLCSLVELETLAIDSKYAIQWPASLISIELLPGYGQHKFPLKPFPPLLQFCKTSYSCWFLLPRLLQSFETLTEVHIPGVFLNDIDCITTFQNLKLLKNLVTLHISYMYNTTLLQNGFESLKKLSFYGETLTNLNDLDHMSSLESLDVSGCRRLIDISVCSKLLALQNLSLNNCDDLTDMAPIGHLKNLKFLSILGCTLTTKIINLNCLGNLPQLEQIHCRQLKVEQNALYKKRRHLFVCPYY